MIYVEINVERDAVEIAATLQRDELDDPDEVAYWIDVGCPRRSAEARPAPDPKFVVVTWRAICEHPLDELRADFTELFVRDPRDEAIVSIDGAPSSTVRASQPIATASYTGPPVERICLAFAIALAIGLVRTDRTWIVRPRRSTAFEAAILVALVALAAPIGCRLGGGSIIDLVVASTAVIVAVAAVIAPAAVWRLAGACVLGLALGQRAVAIVAIGVAAMPLPAIFGATRYRRTVMPAMAAAIVAVGIAWLIECIAGVRIFGL